MPPRNAESAVTSETGARVDAAREWRSRLAGVTGGSLLFLAVSGLALYVLPFSAFNQLNVLGHTAAGIVMLLPMVWYAWRHWRVRRKGNLSHYQLLGYICVLLLAICVASGLVVTTQGITGPRMSAAWDVTHLVSGVAVFLFLLAHLLSVIVRKVKNREALRVLRAARRVFWARTAAGTLLPIAVIGVMALLAGGWLGPERVRQRFAADYVWTFGEDRPFAPSLARLEFGGWRDRVQEDVLEVLDADLRAAYLVEFRELEREPVGLFACVRGSLAPLDLSEPDRAAVESVLARAADEMKRSGAVDPRALSGSAGCGTSGCHHEIYEEWQPSAHRYSSMDDMFQRVQTLMSVETSPEHTRYCAGCHDPISLFSGSKNATNVTLSAEGADEGASCLVCHSVVQTDVQGNGDYTVRLPRRYLFEQDAGRLSKFLSDFLIRTYPSHHVRAYARSLYKTPEFCGACHKQYVDREVNTDIGKVQGQNQYDSWKNSRWYHEGDPERTIGCRECHMPLVDSVDPARGDETDYNRSLDDRKHRSHRMLASNQYTPLEHDLPGAAVHVALTEQWLRGEMEIPEIADKWTDGPVVRMEIVGPDHVSPGAEIALRVVLTNNKTGHDFPTGPLDMIESWVELKATDDAGRVLLHVGTLDDSGYVSNSPIMFKADGFDRAGELIDRHNLWDLVGASYKRMIYPGMTDTASVPLQCPSMARGRVSATGDRLAPGRRVDDYEMTIPDETVLGRITVEAGLWYRKANPEFLDRVYGVEAAVRSPITLMTRAVKKIDVVVDDQASAE